MMKNKNNFQNYEILDKELHSASVQFEKELRSARKRAPFSSKKSSVQFKKELRSARKRVPFS
jgi:hypothetical protein